MTLPFLMYLGLGILQAPAADKVRLLATRTIEKTSCEQGRTSIAVNVTLRNQGRMMEHLLMSDDPRPRVQVVDGRNRQSAVLMPGEEAKLGYTFQSERGIFAWETLHVTACDPFGLIEMRLDLPAAAEIQALPEIRKIRPFPLRTNRTLTSPGSIPARRGGSGTNFWGIREYHPGDPLRRLDWRLTARHPLQFFTKEFEQEAMADIGLILDARGKTNLQQGEDSLFEHSARAAASLAEVFLRQGNRLSLLIWGEPMVSLFPGYGKAQLNRILQALAQVTPDSDGSLNDLHFVPVQMFSSHSLILVISPLAANDWQLFPRLRAFGYQVLLISPDPLDYARAHLPVDNTGRMACRLTRLERQLEISRIRQLWIPVIDWSVSQPLSPLVRQALSRAHIEIERSRTF
ncbi:MAG TPA: DUF58 domain-containing protein [Anaerolineales bacterium]|nr:DUF58 domain-containing protein [Anaerolineales bacterium]